MRVVWPGWVWGAMLLMASGAAMQAQQPIGSVSTSDATVANAEGGVVEANAGKAVMLGSSTVTAKDHTAVVNLARGGEVHVCRSTSVHLTAAPADSLLLALERGAMEIRGKANANDVIVTPDMRITLPDPGPLELDLRVVMNGDTCIDNKGRKAPTLKISDAFGDTSYELKPGQHVLFEHGNLRQVVDRETTPCGCPPDEKPGMSLADAALAGGGSKSPVTPEQATAAHPFPAAESEGLAAPSATPPEPAGTTHVQVGTTLAYDANAPQPETKPDVPPRAVAPVTTPQPVRKSSGNPFAAIGRFFKRIFVR